MASSEKSHNSRWPALLAALLAVIGVVRIISSYSHTSQAFDEPCHVAAAIELLARHTYKLDPVHPPLARIAIGLPLYLAGERYPNLDPLDNSLTYNDYGNAILYDSGHYERNLKLARLGMLPFFLLATAVVFLWARREYGDLAGVMSVALFTTLPNVLAFSSIAYTDMAAGSTQLLLFFAFVHWLDQPTKRSALWLGLAAGLALASKATTVIFFPAAAALLVLAKWLTTRTLVGGTVTTSIQPNLEPSTAAAVSPRELAKQLAIAAALALVTVWATYGFAVGHTREAMNLTSMPSFQNFPAPLARAGRWLVARDPLLPAPALIKGVAVAWVLNHDRPAAYLLGHIKAGGWWYFFLLGVAVKSPLPFLILAGVGAWSLKKFDRQNRWCALAPALAALAVFLVTMPVSYNAGVRHVMVVFPLLAIVAGAGCSYLWRAHIWQANAAGRIAPRVALIALLCWQAVSTARASSDFLAYFNKLAGSDPSKVLVAGCDLDCGQDLDRLALEFQSRHITRATIALWSSADPARSHLPEFVVPQAFVPVTGWFAIGLRTRRFGNSFHTMYPPGAFDWLNAYQPVTHVGKTILLYNLPETNQAPARPPIPSPNRPQ
jgi:4-amino-4-deoxy-L-arabinose transferase-like glycosyltransferase